LKLETEHLPAHGETAEIILPINIIRSASCSIKAQIGLKNYSEKVSDEEIEGFEIVNDNVDFLDEKTEKTETLDTEDYEDELGSYENYSSFDDFVSSNFVVNEDESHVFYDYQGEMNVEDLEDLKPVLWKSLWNGK
jgi:hypothetical protein